MKLCTFTHDGKTRTGIIVGDTVVETGVPGTMIDLIRDWEALKPGLEAKAATGAGIAISEARLEAPVPRPGKIFAIGLNYADHIAESGLGTPERQVWFTKAQTSVNAPYDPILIARGTMTPDYEAELVAVIGKGGKHISAADELGDPHDLGIRCFVNGEERQNSNTQHLVYNVWQQVEHLSVGMTLEPGDCLFTGTPGGIGAAMDPRQFLKAGDVVRTEIDRLGAIEGTMVAEG